MAGSANVTTPTYSTSTIHVHVPSVATSINPFQSATPVHLTVAPVSGTPVLSVPAAVLIATDVMLSTTSVHVRTATGRRVLLSSTVAQRSV